MMDLGFRDFRVRVRGKNALLQIREEDRELFDREDEYILDNLKVYFDQEDLDPVYRKSEI